ncbi:transcription factor bHLH121-like [Coffea arabica]|uniref:Transcription factor bHLH121-like n=1 Tax=Coffea arabica TaxID=13443 RepID=A0A6P6TL17_COFAR
MDREKIFKEVFEPISLNPILKSSDQSSQNEVKRAISELRLGIGPYRSFDHASRNEEKRALAELRLGVGPYSSGSKRRQEDDLDSNGAVVAKTRHQAHGKKLRRNELNEHFQELGNILDTDSVRLKNDEATIVISPIQALKDLASEVSRLQSEQAAILQDIKKLAKENKELREKTSLQFDVGAFEVQRQQRHRSMFPRSAIDPSAVMACAFSYPVAQSVSSGPYPRHTPSLHPKPFLANQSAVPSDPGVMMILRSAAATPHINKPSSRNASTPCIFGKEIARNGSSGQDRSGNGEKSGDIPDMVTDLELAIPGSTAQKPLPRDKGKRPLRD